MFTKPINNMLKQRLGTFLDGLENTKTSIGLKESSMSMTNVKIRCDALDKFMLPVDIKYGIIKKLVIKVPIINIGDRPVSIEL